MQKTQMGNLVTLSLLINVLYNLYSSHLYVKDHDKEKERRRLKTVKRLKCKNDFANLQKQHLQYSVTLYFQQ